MLLSCINDTVNERMKIKRVITNGILNLDICKDYVLQL